MKTERWLVREEEAGERLDRMLYRVLGNMGLRGIRRAINDGLYHVNGQPAKCGTKLHKDDLIESVYNHSRGSMDSQPFLLGSQKEFCFLYKPPGLHSATLAGRNNASLESMADEIFPLAYSDSILLQRLDYGTGGIICAARKNAAVTDYRLWEGAGHCTKLYYALLRGCLDREAVARNALDTRGGEKVRLGPGEADPLRWTNFEPVWQGQLSECSGNVTLVKCFIKSGQRHQIRAHASALGFPLAGDIRYGDSVGRGYYLEHVEITTPIFHVRYVNPESWIKKIFIDRYAALPAGEVGLCM